MRKYVDYMNVIISKYAEYILSTKTSAKENTTQKTMKFVKYNHEKSRENTMIKFQ